MGLGYGVSLSVVTGIARLDGFSIHIIPEVETLEKSRGDDLVLTCYAEGVTYTPPLRWFGPSGEEVASHNALDRSLASSFLIAFFPAMRHLTQIRFHKLYPLLSRYRDLSHPFASSIYI